MATFEDLTERVDRLLLRNRELKRTTSLIADQLLTVTADRDSLKSRLSAARARVDALLARLPAEEPASQPETAAAPEAQQPLETISKAAAKAAQDKQADPP